MGGITPDDTPGPSIEEETQYDDRGPGGDNDGAPTVTGALRRLGDDLLFKTSTGTVSLLSGTGLSASAHKALRDLIHFIDGGPADGFASGMFSVIVGTVFPTSEIWYTVGSVPPAGKIVKLNVVWTAAVPTTKIWKMYDTDGVTVLVTLTETISYSGIFETGRVRTWV
jgi:hypothetical protein